ncbi:Uncharacterized protein TCM_011827 [Theobroma cacao]|uniref:Uncharacterized protein n=1 Tax=Theobroma cacao TaxID=3641 RepID=A0A061EIG5_THECC|nr:Uncharacterized protein TCM_011827 [Theobroma cacao]
MIYRLHESRNPSANILNKSVRDPKGKVTYKYINEEMDTMDLSNEHFQHNIASRRSTI